MLQIGDHFVRVLQSIDKQLLEGTNRVELALMGLQIRGDKSGLDKRIDEIREKTTYQAEVLHIGRKGWLPDRGGTVDIFVEL